MSALDKYRLLTAVLSRYRQVAVAFSGGVDSSLLLQAALVTHGRRVLALHARTPLQPPGESRRALKAAAALGARVEIVELDPYGWPEFTANPPERCYCCKKKIYSIFLARLAAGRPDQSGENQPGERQAGEHQPGERQPGEHQAGEHQAARQTMLLDGTNADDLHSHRPGLRALRELAVATPLAEVGLRKEEIRSLARQQGLANWNKPAASCLATRIMAGQPISREKIAVVSAAEEMLGELGFVGCRLRHFGERCLVEVAPADYHRLFCQDVWLKIKTFCYSRGFVGVDRGKRP